MTNPKENNTETQGKRQYKYGCIYAGDIYKAYQLVIVKTRFLKYKEKNLNNFKHTFQLNN